MSGDRYVMPSSDAQRRLWLAQQLAPASAFYMVPMCLRLRGPLDVASLDRALDTLVARHETLRTSFGEQDGEVVQVIADLTVPLRVVDLRGLDADARERARVTLTTEESRRPFDLSHGPLQRQALLQLADDEYQLLIVTHHIVTDAWSQDTYFRELRLLYEAYTAGRNPALPEAPLQYADYAVWQQEQLTGGRFAAHLDYWQERLDDATPTELPADRPRPDVADHRGDRHSFTFPPSLVARLRRLAEQEHATLYMVLLAVIKTVLAKTTGATDLSVGIPIAGRTRSELETIIGFFVNTLVIRTDLAGDPTFREYLSQVRAACLAAYEHQDVPFENVVEAVAPARAAGRNPLFQIMVVLQNTPAENIRLGELELDYEMVANDTAKFDLNVVLLEDPHGEVKCVFEYATALFDAATMVRFGDRVLTTAWAVADAPETPLSRHPAVSADEADLILRTWNATARPSDDLAPTLHGCLEQAVDRYPDRVAVHDGSTSLTYAELDERANRLANHLLSLGVTPESTVGVCVRRDVDLLVALYGVMKAGAAYLPLDPEYPLERLRLMVRDSRTTVVVTHAEFHDRLPGKVSTVDLDGAAVSRSPSHRPAVPMHGAQLCYVMYTSGSTGTPKAAANEHRGLVNLVAWGRRVFSDEDLAGFSATTSIGFDFSVMELFIPLSFGGSLLVAPSALVLADNARQPRVLHTVPSIATELLRTGQFPSGVAVVVLAGEPLPAELARALHALPPVTRVINIYGVTEASCTSVSAFPTADQQAPTPIGRPIGNNRAYVLDAHLQPVPIGATGDLYVAGAALSRGYAGLPARTAGRFLPDPYAEVPGARMYRTGDLARWSPDGQLVCLGRADAQVKVRGVRIELGEVEASARTCTGVAEAVAVVRRDASGDPNLICYVTAATGADLAAAAVRVHLAGLLPRAMVPAQVVVLDRFPLNPHGKVDRPRLPDPVADAQPPAGPVREDAVETTIAEVWGAVLGLDRVGRTDNFFELGGHSLQLVRVRAMLQSTLGRAVPVVDLFRFPTVRLLAEHLRGGPAPARTEPVTEPAARMDRRVAIVGMQCRVPGANTVEDFWDNLVHGRETISTLEPRRPTPPGYVPRTGRLEDVDLFDAQYFGYSPREAELLDPQQRLLLEVATQALQRAGLDPGQFPGTIGVFAGIGFGDYLWNNILPSANAGRLDGMSGFQAVLSVDKDFAATRVAYKLDLRGPAVTVQTACSTSLVAVHLAVQALLNGECDVALAGGATVMVPARGYVHHEGGIASPDGHCRPFDANAAGTVPGSGAGIVVLRRLTDAHHDNNHIHAIITGTATNNDGAAKVGYTAPSVHGQRDVIRAALRAAGAAPETIGYVEAHGTATPLGDPIELAALTEAYGTGGRIALGSVKSNVGHLDAAAGVTALIKSVLAVEHGTIPPTLHFTAPNPDTTLADGSFHVPTETTPWDGTPRRAGTSSFGMGGTNAHVIIEQAPELPAAPAAETRHVVTLSAHTPEALDVATAELAAHLARHPDTPLRDVAHTLHTGRPHRANRRTVVAHTTEQAAKLLLRDAETAVVDDDAQAGVVLRFGPAAPAVAMRMVAIGEGLPGFAREIEASAAYLLATEAAALRDSLAGAVLSSPVTSLALQFAAARAFAEVGAAPVAVLGTGAGCLVAAAFAGVLPVPAAFEAIRSGAVAEVLAGVELTAPAIPVMSDRDGAWLTDDDARDPEFWARECRDSATSVPLSDEELGSVVLDLSAPPPDATGLDVLAGLWRAGVPVDWQATYDHGAGRRIVLPTVPFRRTRHWIDPPDAEPEVTKDIRRTDIGNWFYTVGWTRTPVPAGVAGDPLSWLIVTDADADALGARLAARLTAAGHLVVTVTPAAGFNQLSSQHFTIDPASHTDAEKLVAVLRDQFGSVPPHWVHSLCATADTPADRRARAAHSPLFLARGLANGQVTTPVTLTVLTHAAQALSGEPELVPEHAMAIAACRVIPQEVPQVRCHAVDVVLPTGAPDRLVEQLVTEVTAANRTHADVAYRDGDRWECRYHRTHLHDTGPSLLRERGVYLLFGGFGTVGAALARHLARTVSARLVLAGRTALPPRRDWDGPLAVHPDAESTAHRIRVVRELEALGAEVLTVDADLCDPAAVHRTVAAAEHAFGRVDGVFHSAGTVSQGPMVPLDLLDQDAVNTQLAAKVDGVRALAAALAGRPLDFVVLNSSLTPILGGVGFGPYAAANAHLDLFAHDQRRRTGVPWSAVNWEGWLPPAAGDASAQLGESLAELALTTEDGAEVLSRLLRGRPAAQTIVSTGDLDQRRARWVEATWQADPEPRDLERHPRPALSTPYLAPRDTTEATLAGLWQRLLGVEPVGVSDSFFDLGGHSLLAIHLVSAVQRELGINLALHAVLEAATVERQAELINGTRGQRADSVVIPLRDNENPDARFFWIHPLGGTVLCYHDLARLLGPGTSSYGLQAPMLFEGIDSYTDLDALAARYVAEIRSVQPRGPYRIGGWSAGGILSVAVARLLTLAGERVQYVGVIEADAPPAGAGADPHSRTLLAALLDRPELTARADLASPPPEMVTEPFADRHPIVAKWLRAHGLVPADQEDRIARLLMVQRRIFRLATPDRLGHYPGTVHVYRTAGRTAEPGLGWQRWADRVVDHEVPGTHETVLHQPNVGQLAELIRRAAREVTGDAGES